MAKKELFKEELLKDEIGLKPRASSSGFSRLAFGIIKFILGISLLPFVYSISVSFFSEFSLLQERLQNSFWAGVITILVIYLFVWEPVKIYTKGQKLLELIFKFFAPLVRVAPYLLPIYFILIGIGYLILSVIVKSPKLVEASIFLLGFSLVFHLIFSAKSLRAKQGDFLKGNYIFGVSFIYILNMLLLAFLLNLIFDRFSFVDFFNRSFLIAKELFGATFKQFFL